MTLPFIEPPTFAAYSHCARCAEAITFIGHGAYFFRFSRKIVEPGNGLPFARPSIAVTRCAIPSAGKGAIAEAEPMEQRDPAQQEAFPASRIRAHPIPIPSKFRPLATLTWFANALILLSVGCAVAFALFLLGRHGWSITYIALIGTGALLSCALLFPPTLKVSVSLALLSVPISFYAGEALLRMLPLPVQTWEEARDQTRGLAWSRDQMDDRAERDKEAGQLFDARDRLQVIEAPESRGIPTYPPIAGKAFVESADGRLLPLAGISRSITVFCNELGEYTIYRSDEHGFHNPPGFVE